MSKIDRPKIVLSSPKEVFLRKTHDNVFGGNHPNGVNTGAVRKGRTVMTPTIGESFQIMTNFGFFITSPVTEIIDLNHFKTENSTYYWKYVD